MVLLLGFVKTDSFDACGAPAIQTFIHTVHGLTRDPQVAPSVVQLVAVFMVDYLSWLRSDKDSMYVLIIRRASGIACLVFPYLGVGKSDHVTHIKYDDVAFAGGVEWSLYSWHCECYGLPDGDA
jgi:hypothetical protein